MKNNRVNTTKKEDVIIAEIAIRANKLMNLDELSTMMDIETCHLKNVELDLKKLLESNDFNFCHDVGGINANLNRDTGKLMNFFLPRFTLKNK